MSWFGKVPGLFNVIELLAWKHRDENPLIYALSTNQSDTDGSEVRVHMIPRSIWDEDPRFLDTYPALCEQLRQIYDHSSFCPNTQFLWTVKMQYSEDRPAVKVNSKSDFRDTVVRGAELVEALTATTRAVDLANAFAWFENRFQRDEAQARVAEIHQAPSDDGARQHYTR